MHKSTLLPLSTLLLTASALAQDPFAPGQRWIHQAPAAQPWLPAEVSFGGLDNLVWARTTGANPRLLALDAHTTLIGAVRAEDSTLLGTATVACTAAARRADALFAAAQYPDTATNGTQRRTYVTRHDPLAAAAGQPFTPVWTHDMQLLTNGALRLATDAQGELVVAATWLSWLNLVRVDLLDGSTGALVHDPLYLPGVALDAVVVAADGSRVAVTAGLDLYVLDGAGNQLHHEPLATSSRALAISGDGATLAVGSIGQLALLAEFGGTWSQVFNILVPQNQIATCAALDADGDTLAVAWWNFATGVDARFEVWDGTTFQRVNHVEQTAGPHARQNMPEAARVTPDGARVAFGTWGNAGNPEALLLAKGVAEPVLALDLPGSVRGLDLDDTGTRLVVSHKDTHANVFAGTGAVRLFDTGERHLQQLGAAELGGTLHLAARHPQAVFSMLLIGERDTPVQIAGVDGLLLLRRSTLGIELSPTDAHGRADYFLPIGTQPALIGIPFSVQPAFRVFGQTVLPEELADPLILQ
jgi:hypothetical protein